MQWRIIYDTNEFVRYQHGIFRGQIRLIGRALAENFRESKCWVSIQMCWTLTSRHVMWTHGQCSHGEKMCQELFWRIGRVFFARLSRFLLCTRFSPFPTIEHAFIRLLSSLLLLPTKPPLRGILFQVFQWKITWASLLTVKQWYS